MAFTCPRCRRTSYNPGDERNGYCGACHAFTADIEWQCPLCANHGNSGEPMVPVSRTGTLSFEVPLQPLEAPSRPYRWRDVASLAIAGLTVRASGRLSERAFERLSALVARGQDDQPPGRYVTETGAVIPVLDYLGPLPPAPEPGDWTEVPGDEPDSDAAVWHPGYREL